MLVLSCCVKSLTGGGDGTAAVRARRAEDYTAIVNVEAGVCVRVSGYFSGVIGAGCHLMELRRLSDRRASGSAGFLG